MIETMTREQKDSLFRKLIMGASDILCDEFGLPRKSFEDIQKMIEAKNAAAVLTPEPNPEPVAE